MEAIEGLCFLASLPLAGTGHTKGGEKTQPCSQFIGRPQTFVELQLRFKLHFPSGGVHI